MHLQLRSNFEVKLLWIPNTESAKKLCIALYVSPERFKERLKYPAFKEGRRQISRKGDIQQRRGRGPTEMEDLGTTEGTEVREMSRGYSEEPKAASYVSTKQGREEIPR